ncbi:thermonuclease family protein [Candidatus Uhrbacteria bacterium]|nr:thermonuclease family protein [Candidatus Uhrbacteria bacterium]
MQKRLWMFLAVLLCIGAGDLVIGYASGGFSLPSSKKSVVVSTAPAQAAKSVEVKSEDATSTPVVEANSTVVKVVDGDTIEAELDSDKKVYKIRFLGINTPETVDPRKAVECFGKEASDKMKELVSGKRIRLEADLQADERDKYGRLLRNAYLEDGTDLNAFMVREGYAYAYLSFPLDARRKAELKKLEQDAKMAGRGLWSPDACGGRK